MPSYFPIRPPVDSRNAAWAYDELKRIQVALQTAGLSINATTTELADAGATVNTHGKTTGRQVYNTTTGLPLWASGPATTDTWDDATGTTQHTPS
jgi:hypothetical protein